MGHSDLHTGCLQPDGSKCMRAMKFHRSKSSCGSVHGAGAGTACSTGVLQVNVAIVPQQELVQGLVDLRHNAHEVHTVKLQCFRLVSSSTASMGHRHSSRDQAEQLPPLGSEQHQTVVMEAAAKLTSDRLRGLLADAMSKAVSANVLRHLEVGAKLSLKLYEQLARCLAAGNSSLEVLSLSGSCCGDAAVGVLLPAITHHPKLQVLELAGCCLTDASAVKLTTLLRAQAANAAQSAWVAGLRGSSSSTSSRRKKGAKKAAVNASAGLHVLDLAHNQLTAGCLAGLASALADEYSSMLHLNLASNKLPTPAFVAEALLQVLTQDPSTNRTFTVDLRGNSSHSSHGDLGAAAAIGDTAAPTAPELSLWAGMFRWDAAVAVERSTEQHAPQHRQRTKNNNNHTSSSSTSQPGKQCALSDEAATQHCTAVAEGRDAAAPTAVMVQAVHANHPRQPSASASVPQVAAAAVEVLAGPALAAVRQQQVSKGFHQSDNGSAAQQNHVLHQNYSTPAQWPDQSSVAAQRQRQQQQQHQQRHKPLSPQQQQQPTWQAKSQDVVRTNVLLSSNAALQGSKIPANGCGGQLQPHAAAAGFTSSSGKLLPALPPSQQQQGQQHRLATCEVSSPTLKQPLTTAASDDWQQLLQAVCQQQAQLTMLLQQQPQNHAKLPHLKAFGSNQQQQYFQQSYQQHIHVHRQNLRQQQHQWQSDNGDIVHEQIMLKELMQVMSGLAADVAWLEQLYSIHPPAPAVSAVSIQPNIM